MVYLLAKLYRKKRKHTELKAGLFIYLMAGVKHKQGYIGKSERICFESQGVGFTCFIHILKICPVLSLGKI